MSEAGDYTPAAHWGGYDFKSARREYNDHVVTSLKDAVVNKVDPKDMVPEHLVCEAESPLILAIDVTGSMGDWPATMFSKLPYLEHEGQEYLGEDMEISFAAVGDAHGDRYPLQVQKFVKGAGLKDALKALIIEGGGGGSSEESYDLAALYYARNVDFPNAIRKPILVFIGDEGVYNYIDSTQANEWCYADTGGKMIPAQLFDELRQKYSVYIIRKPYGSGSGNARGSRDEAIHQQWEGFLGADHVVSLPEAARVVDVLFGILAKETGRIEYFEGELTDRQGKDSDGKHKIDVVLKSLRSVHKLPPASLKKLPAPGKSVTKRKDDSKSKPKKSKSLLD